MAKVLISPIGTGVMTDKSKRKYKDASYKFNDNDNIYQTPFLSAALASYLKVDKIFFIGTGKSMWEEVYRYFTENSNCRLDEDYWLEIAELSEGSNDNNIELNEDLLRETMSSVDNYLKTINPAATGGSLPLIIKYGLNEEELWENFSHFMKFTEMIEDGDELYLDITHSFRSIPLFMYLMMDFIQTLNHKKIRLEGLYYGMFEASYDLGYTPVVDLKPLFQISQWIRGVYDFVNYGNGYLVSELILNENVNIQNSVDIAKKIENISNLLNINYLTDLQEQIKSLNKLLNIEYKVDGPVPYIFPLIKEFDSRFSQIEDASEFQLELSKWYFENKRYGHGYICLTEAILTKLCEVYALDLKDIGNRDKVKGLIVRWHYRKKAQCLEKLYEKYKAVNQIRRRIAHASFYQSGNYSFTSDIGQALRHYKDIKTLLESREINELESVIPIGELQNAN